MRLRSLLYMPAHNAKFVSKAHERGADAIILDLEDSVPEAEKDAARAALATAIPSAGQNGAAVFVRINAGAADMREEVEIACRAGAFGLALPKAGTTAPIVAIADFANAIERQTVRRPLQFIALIESAAAVLDARGIAELPRVIGLAVGGEDLALDLGATPLPDVLRTPKLMVHYAAKAAGKLSLGLLQSVADFSDIEKLRVAAREARLHGFDGATCIHPSAVPVLNEAFAPSEEEIAWARRVVEGAAAGDAVFVVDGRMVDAPVIARARRILGE
jgi:citrate lyase subunit beta/citryl-CoA lyase